MKCLARCVSVVLCTLLVLVISGCGMMERDRSDRQASTQPAERRDRQAERRTGNIATAVLRPSQAATTRPALNNVTGTIIFTEQSGNRIQVSGEVRGLEPNAEHGFHIHEKGDLSAPDFTSAGAHFNPEGKQHGGLHTDQRHVGDLGNIKANAKGVARVDLVMENATLQGKNAIVGRSLLVHAGRDDLKTDPSGESGDRIAGGVIEMRSATRQ